MPMFHVALSRTGPEWDASRPLEEQSGWDDHAAFMDALADDGFLVLGGRERFARDPWTIRLDGRRR
jgi:hypothetical protein